MLQSNLTPKVLKQHLDVSQLLFHFRYEQRNMYHDDLKPANLAAT